MPMTNDDKTIDVHVHQNLHTFSQPRIVVCFRWSIVIQNYGNIFGVNSLWICGCAIVMEWMCICERKFSLFFFFSWLAVNLNSVQFALWCVIDSIVCRVIAIEKLKMFWHYVTYIFCEMDDDADNWCFFVCAINE